MFETPPDCLRCATERDTRARRLRDFRATILFAAASRFAAICLPLPIRARMDFDFARPLSLLLTIFRHLPLPFAYFRHADDYCCRAILRDSATAFPRHFHGRRCLPCR